MARAAPLLLAFALAPAPLAAAGETFEVATPAELLDALGPHRTVRLAPGDYDLSAVARRAAPAVEWKGEGESLRLTVHDVEGLTLAGPPAGRARIFSALPLRLVFERVAGVTLRDLALGDPPRRDLWGPAPVRLVGPEFRDARQVTLERIHALGAGCGPLQLRQVEGLAVSDLRDDGGFGLELYGARGVRVAGARVRLPDSAPWIFTAGADEIVLERVEWTGEAGPGARLEGRVVRPGAAAVSFADVRLIDEVTGKVRREIAGPTARREEPVGDPPVPAILARRRLAGEDEDGAHYAARLLLADGRVAFDVPADERYGLEPGSLRVRRLGGEGGPVLVTWTDQAQGSGNYQAGFYRLLGPGADDGALLQGALALSGHGGGDEGYAGSLEIARVDDLVVLARSTVSEDLSPEPIPGGVAFVGGGPYVRAAAEALEFTYRWTGRALASVRCERFRRLEPGDDPAALLAAGWAASLPRGDGAPPAVGDWLRRELPPAEGETLWPALGPLGVE